MADRITLTLPDELSARVRRIAESREQSVEEVLLEHLRTLSAPLPALSPDQQAELDALQSLSDDALWTIARERMPEEVERRAHALMEQNSTGAISEAERVELEQLVERADRLMLRKAEAAALLKGRGQDITKLGPG